MKNPIVRFFERTELILILGIALALILNIDTSRFKEFIEIGLGIVMYLSLKPFMGKRFHFRNRILEFAKPVLINYILLSGAYVAMAYLFFGTKHDFFTGYILIAIIPPAISIIPFCYISKCDAETADIPVFISFILALIIIPLTLYAVYGKEIDLMILIRIIVILLVVPMILAYMTCRSKSSIFSLSKAIINICLAGVIFISISLNRAIFFDLTNKDILYVYLISLAVIFGLGLLVYAASRKLFSDDAVAYSFYATQKNVGASIAIGIFLFNTDTVVPAIITLAIQFIYFIIFEEVFVKKRLFKKILRNQKY